MSPDARQADQYRTPLRRELADYLSVSGSRLSMAEAAGLAVRAWIAADRAGSEERAGSGDGSLPAARGYLWKQCFCRMQLCCGCCTKGNPTWPKWSAIKSFTGA